jgi:hypothetical protein
MIIQNLEFFGKNGYSLNLDFDGEKWVGDIYFDKTSINLIDSLNIFIMERVENSFSKIKYTYPRYSVDSVLKFELDKLSDSEFFLFDIDKTQNVPYIIKNSYFEYQLDDGILDTLNSEGLRIVGVINDSPLQLNIGYNPKDKSISEGYVNLYNNNQIICKLKMQQKKKAKTFTLFVNWPRKQNLIQKRKSFFGKN